jgi:DNA-binding NarL/FixJ family response regulator
MIKILIADDHQMFRDGVISILKSEEDIEILGEAADGIELIELLSHQEADLIIMDLNMPRLDGVKATERIRVEYPHVKILVVSMSSSLEHVIPIIKSGAQGYLLKNAGKKEFQHAIRTLMEGGEYYSDEINKILRHGFKVDDQAAKIRFTPRELDVLQLICAEFNTAEIAEKLMHMAGVNEDHATAQRRVFKFSKLIQASFRTRSKAVGRRWRLAETYIKVKRR